MSSDKKREMLKKENIMKIYDISGYLSYLMNNSNLLKKIYSNIEFEIADYKWCKEVIKM